MLVLTRRIGEQIVIGRDIHVVVVDISSDRVGLGITAPPAIRVDRREISERRGECAAAVSEQIKHPPVAPPGVP